MGSVIRAFDLQTDPEGNFYFAFGSPVKSGGPGFHRITKTNGTIMKISKDGSKLDIFAAGLRAPNGMCVGPEGQVTIGDNEGSWVPTSPLHWVKQGQFLGMSEAAHGVFTVPTCTSELFISLSKTEMCSARTSGSSPCTFT